MLKKSNTMKTNIIRISCLLALLGSMISCSDYMDLTPKSSATTAGFYKNADDIKTALNACYGPLQSGNMYKGNFVTMMEVRSDNVKDNNPGASSGVYYNIDAFTAGADNTIFRSVWSTCYNQVFRINELLDNIEIVTNPALKSQYEGEACFLRALTYFNMVRLWGDIPVILTPISTDDAYSMSRNSIASVYEAIESDLQKALALPASYQSDSDMGRATSMAAKALLGKVYLTEKKYSDAARILKEVIQSESASCGLLDNVADVFKVSNKLNKEILFAVHYSKSIAGETASTHDAYTKFDIDDNLKESYEATDERADLLQTVPIDGQYIVKKYADTKDPTTLAVGFDFPVLRYSDVLLMYAEALNEVGYDSSASSEALTCLNRVRSRAKASEYTSSQLNSQSTFRDAVLNERRLELPLENHRWFDLLRTGTAISSLAKVNQPISEKDLLYPIPENEVLLMDNPEGFPQNPGY